jgi:pseudouridine-5'-phosphate glycosidase
LVNNTLFAQNLEKRVRELSELMMEATIKRDYETVIEYTHPSIIKLLGGKAKAIEFTSQQMEKVNEAGGIEKCSIREISKIIKVGNELQCVISQEMIMKIEGKRYRSLGGTIGVSEDKGKNWTFLNISQNDLASIRRFIPKFSNKLKLPPKLFELIADE